MSLADFQRSNAVRQVMVLPRGATTALVCRPDPAGWRCMKCGRGMLGPDPTLGAQCRVCKAKVVK